MLNVLIVIARATNRLNKKIIIYEISLRKKVFFSLQKGNKKKTIRKLYTKIRKRKKATANKQKKDETCNYVNLNKYVKEQTPKSEKKKKTAKSFFN